MFKVGQIVKFKAPQTDAEIGERFAVVECRGARILVQCVDKAFDSWQIKPQMTYSASDLTAA